MDKILLVEDDMALIDIYKIIFTKNNFIIDIAENPYPNWPASLKTDVNSSLNSAGKSTHGAETTESIVVAEEELKEIIPEGLTALYVVPFL